MCLLIGVKILSAKTTYNNNNNIKNIMGCNESRKENKISLNEVVLDKLRRLFDRLRTRYRE